MEITEKKIAEWIQIDRRRKVRAEHRRQLFGRVRGIFIFLLVAAIVVFAFNHYTEIQTLASEKFDAAVKKAAASDKLRQAAINYENQVDQVAK
ncbi:MAG TPA: hypothetical protein VMD27_00190 [Candidatus Aquilonibacter sp.]|nr:hypothetical protein [Candidatus Aquilonibacter sp.]